MLMPSCIFSVIAIVMFISADHTAPTKKTVPPWQTETQTMQAPATLSMHTPHDHTPESVI